MEYCKTTENSTPIDVYFDGEKYVFINRFHGLVAVARRDISNGIDEYNAIFQVELTHFIQGHIVERIVRKSECRYVKKNVTFTFKYNDEDECLPYFVSVNLERRK